MAAIAQQNISKSLALLRLGIANDAHVFDIAVIHLASNNKVIAKRRLVSPIGQVAHKYRPSAVDAGLGPVHTQPEVHPIGFDDLVVHLERLGHRVGRCKHHVSLDRLLGRLGADLLGVDADLAHEVLISGLVGGELDALHGDGAQSAALDLAAGFEHGGQRPARGGGRKIPDEYGAISIAIGVGLVVILFGGVGGGSGNSFLRLLWLSFLLFGLVFYFNFRLSGSRCTGIDAVCVFFCAGRHLLLFLQSL